MRAPRAIGVLPDVGHRVDVARLERVVEPPVGEQQVVDVTDAWHASQVHVTSRDGVDVAVYDLGGDGPPLLLAHATGFHGLVWDGFADRLTERFHV